MIDLRNFCVISIIVCLSLGVCRGTTEFESVPTTVKAHKNNSVLLPCYLNTLSTGSEISKEVRWYHDGELIADNGNENFTFPPRHILWANGSLEISNVEPNDTGEYMCEVVRPSPWSTVRQYHAIEVMRPPSVEPDPPSGYLQVKLGEEVRISCKGGGVPYPIISWKSNGEVLQLLDNREMLKFMASDRYLAGTYECTAVNGVGEPASAKIEISIIYPPELTTTRSWIHTAVGHTTQLDCKVAANPSADVVWFKAEVPVPLDKRVFIKVEGDKNTLFIKNVQVSDFGIYTCRAQNDLGMGELQIQLSGVPNPGVFKKNPRKSVNPKNSYTLIWEVDSYTPVIEYNLWFRPYRARNGLGRPEWNKLTVPSEPTTGFVYSKSYTIKGLKEKTIYEALLVSRNRYGWSRPSPILRFATEGADLKEEIITPVRMRPEDTNIIPLDLTSSAKTPSPFKHFCFLLIIKSLYI